MKKSSLIDLNVFRKVLIGLGISSSLFYPNNALADSYLTSKNEVTTTVQQTKKITGNVTNKKCTFRLNCFYCTLLYAIFQQEIQEIFTWIVTVLSLYSIFRCFQYLHEFLACNGFMFIEVFGKFMKL